MFFNYICFSYFLNACPMDYIWHLIKKWFLKIIYCGKSGNQIAPLSRICCLTCCGCFCLMSLLDYCCAVYILCHVRPLESLISYFSYQLVVKQRFPFIFWTNYFPSLCWGVACSTCWGMCSLIPQVVHNFASAFIAWG